MDILSLGTETNLFVPGSRARARIAEYGKLCRSLHIVVPTVGTSYTRETIAPNVFIYPTNSSSRIAAAFALLRIASTIATNTLRPHERIITVQDPFEIGLLGLWIARRQHIPLHVQVHTDIESPYFKKESFRRRLQTWMAHIVLRRADHVRVVSSRIKKSLEARGVSPEQIDVLPIATQWRILEQKLPTLDVKKKYPSITPAILIASRLSPEKNIAIAIRAFRAIAAKYPQAGLVIVGDGPEEPRLRTMVRAYQLEERIHFEGWTDDIISYMKTADAFVLPSTYEGWGVSVIEAAAARLPVIMTDVGCAGEFCINGESGIVIPVGDERALIEALEHLIATPGLRMKLTEEAFARLSLLPDQMLHEKMLRASYEAAHTHYETTHPHTESR